MPSDAPAISAQGLIFNSDGYVIGGTNALTLSGPAPTISVTYAGYSTTISAKLAGTAGLLGLSAIATSVYAGGIEPYGLVVTRYKPRPAAWPVGRKLSITVIADLHAGGPDMTLPHIRRIVETANGLKSDLVVLLGTPEVANSQLANFVPDYRVTIEVQRFESIQGQAAVVEAVWTVRKTAVGVIRSGRTVAREPVQGQGFDALAAAHSQAIAKMSGDIAAAIRAEAEQKS